MSSDNRKEKRAINFTRPISERVAEEILGDFSKIPMVDVLVEVFRKFANLQTIRARRISSGCIIYANAKESKSGASLVFQETSGKFNLRIYHGSIEEIPGPGWADIRCPQVAVISAGLIRTGIRNPQKGYQTIRAITVHLHPGIFLPTRFGKWLFGLFDVLTMLANEFHLDISEQPKFWEKKEGFKERSQPDDIPDVE